ncbi:uncharacterized protein [Eurosta solidaginis]|uniref:uncharacterized protein n=1 Tax=Eurosta solidaginis TaxID=178769 RepID=UPI0035311BDB
MGHQNTEATICSKRRLFWVPCLRSLLRSVIASCPVCRLRKAIPVPPLMGPLTIDRLTPYVRPFTYTGLDYFGPVYVTVRRSTEKRWVALFTCLTIRAVHLEVDHDLSTDSCIRNFINRRGVPKRLRSDNGKNFVGTNNDAKRFDEVFDCTQIQDELSKRGIEWIFNSPLNPAEGGAWERMVRSIKRVLQQTIKEVKPREHTFNCFLIEAENNVDYRSLTHLPIDAKQEQPLTPNGFLLGSANTAQTPGSSEVVTDTLAIRQQWRIARQIRDNFWKRWIAEYLPTLTRRKKWCQRTQPVKKGDLVLLCDPNVPRR